MIIRSKFPKVYELEHPKTGRYWLVDARKKKWNMDERKTFSSKTLAIKHASDIEEQLVKFGAQADVPKEKVVMADRFQGLTIQLAHFGKTPEDAVEHYVQHLGNEALKQAKPFISKLVDEWVQYKSADTNLSDKYLTDARSYARFIKRTWGDLKPDEPKKNQIDLLIKGLKVTNNTRRKYLRYIRMFFNWVVVEGHVLKNPTLGLSFKSDDFNGAFYTPEQTKKLLRYVIENHKDLAGYFAVMTFSGLRPTEGQRVQWEDYFPKVGQLYVRKGKTNARHVNLEPVTVEWLKFHQQNTPKDAPFVTMKSLENRMKVIRNEVFKGGWIQDGLRHGFGTYYKTLIKDIGKVADQMGNSPDVVKRHYARTIAADECDLFWGLTPSKVMEDDPAPTTA